MWAKSIVYISSFSPAKATRIRQCGQTLSSSASPPLALCSDLLCTMWKCIFQGYRNLHGSNSVSWNDVMAHYARIAAACGRHGYSSDFCILRRPFPRVKFTRDSYVAAAIASVPLGCNTTGLLAWSLPGSSHERKQVGVTILICTLCRVYAEIFR